MEYFVLVPRRLPQPTQLELDVPKYKRRDGVDSVDYDISWRYNFSGWFCFLAFIFQHLMCVCVCVCGSGCGCGCGCGCVRACVRVHVRARVCCAFPL